MKPVIRALPKMSQGKIFFFLFNVLVSGFISFKGGSWDGQRTQSAIIIVGDIRSETELIFLSPQKHIKTYWFAVIILELFRRSFFS